jgi:putative NADH-flavin reductase
MRKEVASKGDTGMRIIVFGITGRIGSRVAKEALDRGHEVTGIARDPSSFTLKHPKLQVAKGDVTDASSVASVAANLCVPLRKFFEDATPALPTEILQILASLRQPYAKRALRGQRMANFTDCREVSYPNLSFMS